MDDSPRPGCNHLKLVGPEEVQAFWPLVLPGILACQRHSVAHWIPEDVYSALRTGHSNLYLGYVGDYAGFAVVTPSQTWDGRVLHFWCVHNASQHDILTLFSEDFLKIARQIGARRMTFWSPRRWERRIAKYGFKPAQVEFVKEL